MHSCVHLKLLIVIVAMLNQQLLVDQSSDTGQQHYQH